MNYDHLRQIAESETLPAGFVDLDALERNVDRIAKLVRASGKTLRVASKSVRVPKLLSMILARGGDAFRGLLCYSAEEAAFLAKQGFTDLLVAYPTIQTAELEAAWEIAQSGMPMTLMADEPEHLRIYAELWSRKKREHPQAPALPVCIDIDLSLRIAGLHLGVQRSPLRTIAEVGRLLDELARLPPGILELRGIMGYEAQVAGLQDKNPFHPLLNPIKRWIRRTSIRLAARRRREVSEELARRGFAPAIFNGGGTGSLHSSTREPWLTEVTAGSGFLQSHLFDYYGEAHGEPAFAFALRATRSPEPGILTCQGGGFIASGEIGPEKAPLPYLPQGMRIIGAEGFGEVQTPIRLAGSALGVGAPLFFRPAKAGEIAERFPEYLLVRGDQVIERVPTYRGLGKSFY
jgi:D-serine deaminase-like pyridoxal phosphate-dependent protein